MSLVLRVSSLDESEVARLPSEIWHTLLQNFRLPAAMQKGPAAKRRRVSREEHMKFERLPKTRWIFYENNSLVLEVVELSKPADHPALLHGLFCTLGELQNFSMQTDSELGILKDYHDQLLTFKSLIS